jgi:hypothetical protein
VYNAAAMPPGLPDIHRSLATSLFLFTAIAGVWGLVMYARRSPITGTYWGILAALELLALAQAAVGAVMLVGGAQPARAVHILYGLTSVVALPGVYAYTRGRDDRRATLVYALLCLFLLGVSLRAAGTAG